MILGIYKVEFENERVRVLRIKYGPCEKSMMHSHPESIAIFLTDAHGKFTYPDGRTEDINANPGTVQHMDAHTHLPESLSKTPFEVIAVELKRCVRRSNAPEDHSSKSVEPRSRER